MSSNNAAETAIRLLDNLEAGKFEAAVSDFNDGLRAALGAEKLREIQQQFGMAGPVEKRDPPEIVRWRDPIIVVTRIRRKTATLDATIAIDRSGKVSGLHYSPAVSSSSPSKSAQDDAAFRETEVAIGEASANALPGTLTMPADQPKRHGAGVPAVVLIHGSGPQDRDQAVSEIRPFLDLAHGLARNGVAVLRYDKRTKVQPEKFKGRTYTVDDETTKDAVSAVRFLRGTEGIDPTRIFVLGHSMGGAVAPRVAQRSDRVAGVILLAAPARSMLVLLSEQMRRLFSQDGNLNEDERQLLDNVGRITDGVVRPGAPQTSETEKEIMGAPMAYWRSVHEIDAIGDARKLRCGLLVLQGGHDRQVSREDWAIWKSALSRKERVTYRYYPSLDHFGIAESAARQSPEQAEADAQVGGRVEDELILDISRWILQSPAVPC